jgi:hypothetical protein
VGGRVGLNVGFAVGAKVGLVGAGVGGTLEFEGANVGLALGSTS